MLATLERQHLLFVFGIAEAREGVLVELGL